MTDERRRRLGATGEQLAADHLQRLGLQILDRNYRTRWGELDLVVYDEKRLIFVEVKTRIAYGHGPERDPLESLHPRKQHQVRAMAKNWLVERRDRPHADALRFDAIGVTLDRAGRLLRLDHLEAAF